MQAISACLLGVSCRYDGRSLSPEQCLSATGSSRWVPICPEQLGGLPTPRPAAEIRGGAGRDVLAGRARVIDVRGRDVTEDFLRGAHEALRLCRRLGIRAALLKSRSPSCGVGWIRRGDELVPGDGVTAALLREHGIEVLGHPD
ncbi:MAG: DUF523 domain-containing protein [Candidatus Eisenbacteria bacterium]|uniref:DUF523 domain-containing protein n=1 Tax=Eiseniibacteriota bacterium TaxID=2212470 RepID=A0A937X9A3_UNCEI|nr:DUF523 domain-containing protein [Candidatus Eisenbacteria bacterium]